MAAAAAAWGGGGATNSGSTPTRKRPADTASAPCVYGCGHTQFRHYPTCCTHCHGPTGPHAHDCTVRNSAVSTADPRAKRPRDALTPSTGESTASDVVVAATSTAPSDGLSDFAREAYRLAEEQQRAFGDVENDDDDGSGSSSVLGSNVPSDEDENDEGGLQGWLGGIASRVAGMVQTVDAVGAVAAGVVSNLASATTSLGQHLTPPANTQGSAGKPTGWDTSVAARGSATMQSGATAIVDLSDIDQYFKNITAKQRTGLLSLIFDRTLTTLNRWRIDWEKKHPKATFWKLCEACYEADPSTLRHQRRSPIRRLSGSDVLPASAHEQDAAQAPRPVRASAVTARLISADMAAAAAASDDDGAKARGDDHGESESDLDDQLVARAVAIVPDGFVASHGQRLLTEAVVKYVVKRLAAIGADAAFSDAFEDIDEVSEGDPSDSGFVCSICSGRFKFEHFICCGGSAELHWTCRPCFGSYVSITVAPTNVGPDAVPCPSPGCGATYAVADVTRSIPPKTLFEMTERAESASRSAAIRQGVKATLSCKCGTHGVVLDDDVGDGNVRCPGCSTYYCIECGNESHDGPCLAPADTLEWLTKRTKRCPQCKTAIEKNKGCSHMHCDRRAGGCGYDFCWVCLGKHGACHCMRRQ